MKKIAAVSLTILLVAFDAAATAKRSPQGKGNAPNSKASAQTSIRTPVVQAGDSFEIDAADLYSRLGTLAEDERREQIADWVVYATLIHTQASAKLIRDALYDRPPIRHPALEETVNFDYGPGRRVAMPDKTVWLFRSEIDEHPKATLARLADQARMELGETPRSFTVFVYRTRLTEGTINVRVDTVVPDIELYSSAYGYVESRISDLQSFTDWLSRVDDVVHVRTTKEGMLELAGRRHPDAPTNGVTLEHVATLYQAHRRLAESHDKDAANARQGALVAAIEQNHELVNEAKALDHNSFVKAATDWVQMLDSSSRAVRAAGYTVTATAVSMADIRTATTLESQNAIYERLVDHTVELFGIAPDEPGFSLDWSFNGTGLVRDLRSILENPAALIAEAQALAETAHEYTNAARPAAVWAALEASMTVEDDFAITAGQREQISDVLGDIAATGNLQDYQMEGFNHVIRRLMESPGGEPLALLLKYVNVKHARQCARYDGPLQGTLVGMNLFYTDLLAKLWASVDYYEKAPVDEVVGFRSKPRLRVEPTYWREVRDKPATRLWFGPKTESYSVSANGGEINFAHIATRVFSRGSDTDSRKESAAAETSRRVYHWWDRHYGYVANYEQQYHIQNQIMKWSVITGWAVENALLDFLDHGTIPVRRAIRFDNWYTSTTDLRFRDDIRMLPESEWPGTECLELLQSYPFEAMSEASYILGGVSLAPRRATKAEGAVTVKELAPAARRAGLVNDPKGALKSVSKETEYILPQETPKTLIKPHASTATRSAGAQLKTSGFETSIANNGTTGKVRIMSGRHELAELGYEHANGCVKLASTSGEVEVAERLTEAIAGTNHVGIPFAALKDTYYIDTPQGGFDVISIVSHAGGQRAFELTIGKEARGLMHAGFGASGEFVVSAAPIKIADAISRLASRTWQRLEPGNLLLSRLFTNQGPPPTATPLKLRLASGAELDAFVDRGAVYVRRPSKNAKEFEALVEHEELTPEFIETLQRQEAGTALSTPALDMRPQNTGNPDTAALNELVDAARRGDLDHGLQAFRKKYSDTAWKDLGGNGMSPVPPPDGLNADLLVAKTLVDLDSRNLESAERSLRGVLNAGPLSPQTMSILERFNTRFGVEVITDIVRTRLDGVSPDFLTRVEIRATKRRLHTAVNLDNVAKTITVAEDKAKYLRVARNRRDPVYVDQRLLDRYDWDSMPGHSMHRAMKDPHIVIEVIEIAGAGEFRPSMLIEGQQAYVGLRTGPDHHVKSVEDIVEPSRVIRMRYQPCQEETDPDCNDNAA